MTGGVTCDADTCATACIRHQMHMDPFKSPRHHLTWLRFVCILMIKLQWSRDSSVRPQRRTWGEGWGFPQIVLWGKISISTLLGKPLAKQHLPVAGSGCLLAPIPTSGPSTLPS